MKSAFLNGQLQEKVYMSQPLIFMKKNQEMVVYKLHKALYGLKQALIVWNLKIDSFSSFNDSENVRWSMMFMFSIHLIAI